MTLEETIQGLTPSAYRALAFSQGGEGNPLQRGVGLATARELEDLELITAHRFFTRRGDIIRDRIIADLLDRAFGPEGS